MTSNGGLSVSCSPSTSGTPTPERSYTGSPAEYDESRCQIFGKETVKTLDKQFPDCKPIDECAVHHKLVKHASSIDLSRPLAQELQNESKVLVLYTGGTIGMVRNADGVLAPKSHAMEDMIRKTITMHDEEYSRTCFKHLHKEGHLLPLVLPHVEDHRRVIYTIYEYDPLLDSCNMTMDDWIQIAKDIKYSYEYFDGFVILHGTDTLAYTASALSFMLEHLGKPVIVTGSQIPCFETRSDGRDNFIGALIIAGNYNIPEVCVYFRHKLMRGNRTIKMSSGDLNAFDSPNMTPLVEMNIDIEVNHRAIHRPTEIKKFQVHTLLNRNVVLLRLFPSMRTDTVKHFLAPPIEGVVLQCYGSGNIPNNRVDIMNLLKEATKRGVLIISCTQCAHGSVSGIYETGKALLDAGVIPGSDITPEAALTKLSYVLSKANWNNDERRRMMEKNLVGEMTVVKSKAKGPLSQSIIDVLDLEELDLIEAVGEYLNLTTLDEMKEIRGILLPSIVCSTVYRGNIPRMETLTRFGADMSVADYDMRTPLHIAASEGNLEMVEFLLKSGAGIHMRDRNNDTPLMCAIDNENLEVIQLLVSCGAHVTMPAVELGEKLCYNARMGRVPWLRGMRTAGVDLNVTNATMQTALHAAVEANQKEVVEFLVRMQVSMSKVDMYGNKAVDIAKMLKRQEILQILMPVDENTSL